jgi:metal-responsive CopG/Arc/MetJ family transcriptional regulator
VARALRVRKEAYNQGMERTETRIDRRLVERARSRARREGRDESELIEDALRRYLDEAGDRPSITESLERARRRREASGIPELSEEEAMRIAVEEQHAYRRGE